MARREPGAGWHSIRRVSEPERFFFVHLQKTAGTTLFRRIRHHFGPEAVYPTPEHQVHPEAILDVDYLRDVFERQGDQIRVVTGHFPYCTTELLGVPFKTFSVLREPLARTLSVVRRNRERVPELADATPEEVYGRPFALHSFVHNHMVKMLGLTPELMTHGVSTMVTFDEPFLERAKANLQRLDVVGVQQDFTAFCDELERRFGWDLGENHHANTSSSELGEISEEFKARILHDNAMDVELYRFAVDLLATRSAGSTLG